MFFYHPANFDELMYCYTDRWELPEHENSVLASTANELRNDRYSQVNPEKLKAAAEGLSQSMCY